VQIIFRYEIYWGLPRGYGNIYRIIFSKPYRPEVKRMISENFIKIGLLLQNMTVDWFHDIACWKFLLENL